MTYLIYITIISFFWVRIKPKNDRVWSSDHAVLPYSKMIQNVVQIYNIRNFTYLSKDKVDKRYYSKSYDLTHIEKMYYVVVPFQKLPGAAHVFLSFEFRNHKHIAISIEARRRKGLKYSFIRAFLKGHELTYVIADENDVIKLRSNYLHDDVYIYPMQILKEDVRNIFIDMLDRANALHDKPEFYNLFTNTCATNLFDHINNVIPKRVPRNFAQLLPKFSDKFVYDIGLISTKAPFDETKKLHHINKRAKKYAKHPNFPTKIREINTATNVQ